MPDGKIYLNKNFTIKDAENKNLSLECLIKKYTIMNTENKNLPVRVQAIESA